MRSAVVAIAMGLAADASAGGPRYGLGRAPTAAELRAADLTILPTGAGLPVGRGSARTGRALYAARCAACHGLRGEGTDAFPALAGGGGSLRTATPILTVTSYWPYATTLWDYTRRGMPYGAPGTLSPDEVYALTAYVLHLGGVIEEDTVLTERTLPAVRMPNHAGFVADPRPDVPPSR